MEKHYFTFFKFNKTDYDDSIDIGVHENFISSWRRSHQYLDQERTYYYPKSKRNIIRKRDRGENYYNEYSAFLEKLFYFAKEEKIKRIRTNYSIEINPYEEIKLQEAKKVLFK